MQYLIYVLAFIPFATCFGVRLLPPLSPTPKGPAYTCKNPSGSIVQTIPISETRAPTQKTCIEIKSPAQQITNFPMIYNPFYNQPFEAKSKTDTYLISPLDQNKYKNVYIITNEKCAFSSVVMATGSKGLNIVQKDILPGTRPIDLSKSRRTRPAQPPLIKARKVTPGLQATSSGIVTCTFNK
ncbi:hypothetical protein OnM2_065048 [Erysiphe neolycopersici]|uniref:Uncharacterized protein n=1 Tax=Erysiphe neolycopersici TaxID=212602 RepID=A0A420HMV1_9PEZI|nr:hypothetical protein OnM2_065048 [Erysiphe neolycopersici]